ncbi:hypothetical protein Efla_002673 [Eimeria flavescens]
MTLRKVGARRKTKKKQQAHSMVGGPHAYGVYTARRPRIKTKDRRSPVVFLAAARKEQSAPCFHSALKMVGRCNWGLLRGLGAPAVAAFLLSHQPQQVRAAGGNGESPPGVFHQPMASGVPAPSVSASHFGMPDPPFGARGGASVPSVSPSLPAIQQLQPLPPLSVAMPPQGMAGGVGAAGPASAASLTFGGSPSMPSLGASSFGAPMAPMVGGGMPLPAMAGVPAAASFGGSDGGFLSHFPQRTAAAGDPGSLLAGGLGTGGPLLVNSKLSQTAMAASLPLETGEPGDVLNASLVSDTSSPVGFHSSVNGTYAVPRFPSAVHNIRQPSEEQIKKCILRIPASKMTNGFSDTLKSGGVQIMGNSKEQLLKVISSSSPRYTSKFAAPYVLFQRATGARVHYELKLGVPRGCVLLPTDPNLMAFVTRIGKYITEAKVKLLPDILAVYSPSVAAIPADVLSFAARLPPNSNFQSAGHCVFIAHFMAPPESIKMSASYTEVLIEVGAEVGSYEALGMQIPVKCLPQSLQRIAMWTAPMTTGTAVIVAFSPPPHPQLQAEWFLLRSTSDENEFNSTASSHS